MAGPHPGGVFEPAPLNIAQLFFNCNIRHFVDLTDKGEYGPYIPAWEKVDGMEARDAFTYKQFSITDFTVPVPELAKKVLDYIDSTISEGRGAVYVHCYAGVGRTGTIVGIFLARHGIAEGTGVALKIEELRASTRKSQYYYGSPQSHAQFKMIKDWKRDE
nr:protein-tyrosine phosphatase family protein [Candidatus Sigynarchaeota archaeon]